MNIKKLEKIVITFSQYIKILCNKNQAIYIYSKLFVFFKNNKTPGFLAIYLSLRNTFYNLFSPELNLFKDIILDN